MKTTRIDESSQDFVPLASSMKSRNANGKILQRKTSYDAGRGLEILGHAIEYVIDESILNDKDSSYRHAQREAVELMMALDREIHSGCPIIPPFRERLLWWSRRIIKNMRHAH